MSSETFKLGIDVGGTFTDFSCGRAAARSRATRRSPRPTIRPSACWTAWPRSRRLTASSATIRQAREHHRARHDGDHQRDAHPARRQDRPAHHRRRARRAGDAPRDPRGAVQQPAARTCARWCPRYLRRPVRGRLDWKGRELEALVESDVSEGLALMKADGVGAVAICFMNAFANPEHERRVRRDRAPGAAGRVRQRVERGPARRALLQPRLDHGARRLHRSGAAELPRTNLTSPPGRGELRRRALDHAVERRRGAAGG